MYTTDVIWNCDKGRIDRYGLFTAGSTLGIYTIEAIDTLTGIKGTAVALIDSIIPVELSSFSANHDGKQILLSWITETETNNYGFEVERKRQETGDRSQDVNPIRLPDGQEFEKVGFVKGKGTTAEKKNYIFIDNSNLINGVNKYRLKQIDLDGTFTYSDEVEIEFAVRSYSLEQNYPNPFNPATTIKFALPVPGKVKLEVYTILGEKVIELLNETKEAGYYQVEWNANGISSGVYFYTIYVNPENGSNDFRKVKKMLMLK